MPRSPRFHAPSLLYHIISRGNNQQPIFQQTKDYQRFLDNLKKYQQKFKFQLLSYCLMPNHIHLLIQVDQIPLSKIMQTLLTAYTMFHHKKYQTTGHLFQGRFKSIIVDKDQYLLQVCKYIHLNPVKAGLVAHPNEYPWSSYHLFIKSSNQSKIINPQPILDLMLTFSPSRPAAESFKKYILAEIDQNFDPEKLSTRGILGNTKFQQKITKIIRVRP